MRADPKTPEAHLATARALDKAVLSTSRPPAVATRVVGLVAKVQNDFQCPLGSILLPKRRRLTNNLAPPLTVAEARDDSDHLRQDQ